MRRDAIYQWTPCVPHAGKVPKSQQIRQATNMCREGEGDWGFKLEEMRRILCGRAIPIATPIPYAMILKRYEVTTATARLYYELDDFDPAREIMYKCCRPTCAFS